MSISIFSDYADLSEEYRIGFKDCLWWIQSHLKLPLDKPEEIKVGTTIFRMANEYVFTPDQIKRAFK